MSTASFDMTRAVGRALVVWLVMLPALALGQWYARNPEAVPLLQEGAVVHRRVTMLGRRVQRDLGESRRYRAMQRAACLNPVLSDLHSTQRALEAWTAEITRAETITARQRGMLKVFRQHLKELRAEALGCFGGGALTRAGVRVKIAAPQPDEEPSQLRRPSEDDTPWALPRR